MIPALVIFMIGCAGADPEGSAGQVIGTYPSDVAAFKLVRVIAGLDHPWSFAFLPDNDILVTERPGALWRFDGDGLTQIAGVPDVAAVGQGGLLDVIVHPSYSENGWIYLSYADSYGGGNGTVVARARLESDRLADIEEIFRSNNPASGGHHFGSRLVFDNQGYLYITLGERGSMDRAQDTSDHPGSVIRLNDDGTIPADNPFIGTPPARPEIFSYGHRNAQGIALNPGTGDIWLHEHGPQGGDEINIIGSGRNYGWPVITYGVNYGSGTPIGEGTEKPGMEQPVTYWVPSIAPSGMAFYTGDAFPAWQGDLFVGALAGQHLRRVVLDGDTVVAEEVILQGEVGRIRDVRQSPDGLIYFVTDADSGGLYRLDPLP